jgi:glycosyltransferase involved in cell wall biosynthesis
MKILNVINVRWYNATAWYAVSLSSALKKSGHDVIVCGQPGTPPVEKAKELGLEVFEAEFNSSNPIKLFKTMNRVRKLLKSYKPDAVACHRGEFFWYFAIKKFFTRPRWKLIRVRGDIRPPKADIINRWMHNTVADKVVVSGEFIKQQFVENLKSNDEHVMVLHGGVDREIFKHLDFGRIRVRDEYGWTDDDFVVGIVGRFDPIKGHEILFRAVADVLHNNKNKNIKLMIAGFDAVTTTDDINALLKRFKLEDISVITGKRDDIAALMSAMDLGVVSSVGSEAICRVGMEIMSCGIPIVVSDTGVLPEIVPECNVYPKYEPEKLTEALIEHSKDLKIYDLNEFAEKFVSILEKKKSK